MASNYSGERVFITGGSAGIGCALARALARQGAHVIIAARGEDRLREALAMMEDERQSETQRLDFVTMDVTDAEQVEQGAARAIELLGGTIDVLICNSGYAQTGTSLELDPQVHRDLFEVNYMGHVHTVRAFAPYFIEQKRGEICLLSSMLGFFSIWGYGAYSASKYAISGFAEALRQEMLEHNVGVTLFYPPTTETPGLEKENEGKDPLIWAMESESGWTKTYTADDVATAVLDAIPSRRFEAWIGFDSWLVYKTYQHFPRLARYLSDLELQKAREKISS